MTGLPPLGIDPLPGIDLRHMLLLTDDTAMLQHAAHATPNLYHGYCTDDNARALIAAVKSIALGVHVPRSTAAGAVATDSLRVCTQRYLAFLSYAFNAEAGRLRNYMGYDRTWAEGVGSEDSHARAVWAAGTAVRLGPSDDIRQLADSLMQQILPAVEGFEGMRPWAFALLGIDEYLRGSGDHGDARRLRAVLAERMLEVWRENSSRKWPWWEDHLTWANAKLPHAVLVSGSALENRDMVQAAVTALRWLLEVQTGPAGQLSIIGNDGWYVRGGRKAQFDQQPIEAQGLVQACVAAAAITREDYWARQARRCFQWFTGHNDLNLALYNAQTGGCHDGLTAGGVNSNQGAESTLAYILSVLDLHHYERARKSEQDAASARDRS